MSGLQQRQRFFLLGGEEVLAELFQLESRNFLLKIGQVDQDLIGIPQTGLGDEEKGSEPFECESGHEMVELQGKLDVPLLEFGLQLVYSVGLNAHPKHLFLGDGTVQQYLPKSVISLGLVEQEHELGKKVVSDFFHSDLLDSVFDHQIQSLKPLADSILFDEH